MKKIFKIFLFALLGLLVLSVVTGLLFSKQIGNSVLAEIQKSMTTEMKVKDFGIELFSGFPNASLNFKGVTVKDTKGQNLAEAKKISFRFGLLSLFNQNIDVKSVIVKDAALYIHFDRKGAPNYDIFKKSSGTTSSKGLNIRKAVLSDVEVIYEDDRAKQTGRFNIDEAVFSGLFSSQKFDLKSYADGQVGFFEVDGERYLAGADVSYDAKILVDLDKNKYTLKDCNLFFADSEFDVKGAVKFNKKSTDLNLKIKGEDALLESLFSLFSEEKQAKFKGIKTKGHLRVNGTVKGRLSANKKPDIKFVFGIRKGKIYGGPLTEAIENFSFSGKLYSIGKKSKIELSNIKGYVDGKGFQSELVVKNFKDPFVDFGFSGALPVSMMVGNNKTISGNGELAVKNFSLMGYYKNLANPAKIKQVKIGGSVLIDDAGIKINNQDITLDKGQLTFDQNEISLDNLKIDGIGQEVKLSGYAKNFIPVFFADSLNSQKAQLLFKLNATAKDLDLQRIMAAIVPESKANKKKKVTAQKDIDLSFAEYLNGDFVMDVERFSYDKIKGKNFEGKLAFRGREVSLTGDAEAMGGDISLEGTGFLVQKPRLTAFLVLDNVDVTELFRQSGDFGQSFISYKNLKGRIDARTIINAYWNEKGIFDTKKLTVLAEMRIRNGELNNFKMMENFAAFVNVKDLRHIRFTELENWLEIKKRKVYIPTMFIQSNAANLFVSGQHSFDQKISYNLKVNAAQIIANKFKKHDPSLRPQKAKKKGWFNLYYTIRGTTDNFTYRRDKKSVQKSFAREENRKRRIRRVLNKEFGASATAAIASHSAGIANDLNDLNDLNDEGEVFLPEITPSHSKPLKKTNPKNKKENKNELKVNSEGYLEFEDEI